MAEQQRIAPPFGDIFFVNTPTLDALSKQLYAEQKQRQSLQYQENKALDDGMRKEFANVRSVDTPEVIGAYNQYKNLKKQLYFDKSLKKDPIAFNQKQQEANAALQKTYEVINGSGEMKEMSKSLLGEKIKNPDGMADDSGQRLAAFNNTPYSQVRNHPQFGDLANPDTYRYQGSNTDFGKVIKDASGTPKDILGKSIPIDKGFQTQTSVYQFGNSPAQVYDHLINSMAMHRTGRDAAYQWDKINPDQIQATVEKFKQIPKEKWAKMGIPDGQDLGNFSDNKADNYAKYLAMNYAINAEPREGKPIIKENKSAILSWQLNKEKVMAGILHGDRMAEISLRDELKDKGEAEQNDYMDELYGGLRTDALKNRRPYRPANGQPYDQYAIKATEGVKKLFATKDAKGHEIFPDELRFSKDFGTVTPIFLEHYVDAKTGARLPKVVKNAKTGEAEVIKDLSKPILEPEFKEMWKKEIMGVGAYGKTLKGKKAPTANYKIEGKSYSHKQLNDMGYDDNEINQAIKAGIISK